MAALVAAAGFRSSTGALLEPLENEFGWSRATTSGCCQPQPDRVRAHRSLRSRPHGALRRTPVVAAALTLVALGSGLTLVMTSAWQLWLLWGFAVGVGTGSLALVFGAIVANRWFVRHRGLVIGMFSAASPPGQLVFLPAIAHLAAGSGVALAAGLVTSFALALVRWRGGCSATAPATSAPSLRRPRRPRGSRAGPDGRGAAAMALSTLRWVSRSWTFWVLVGTFWVCGWSTNGLIGTHFIPAAHDHGMPATTSANLLALIGIFDIVGTIASGWLTDRVDSRLPAVRLLLPSAVFPCWV